MKTLYYNGYVFTGKEVVNSFVVEDGYFQEVTNIQTFDATNYDTCIDLNNRFVCAGFNDSHMHLLGYGNALRNAPLYKHSESLEELITFAKSFLEDHPISNNRWYRGRGWNQDYFQDVHRMPTKDDLDSISKDIPIIFSRACGHCAVVNSKALEICNITKDTEDILGGEIGKDENGELNGLFFDNAIDLIEKNIPLPSKEEIKEMIILACKSLNAFGITSAQSDDYCVFREIPFEIINEAYNELKEEGQLTVRVYEQSNFTEFNEFQRFVESGNVTGYGDALFKIGPLKMLGDGSLGSRTACLSKPYYDDPSTQGFNLFSDDHMNTMIDYANKNHMQVAVHAIGDACLDQVLQAIELALKNMPRENHRHGIVHCQISRSDQLDKMAELKLHGYAQSIFLDYDNHIVLDRVGEELAATSYNWKTLMQKGVTISNGSDAPVEMPDVLKGMQCAITRTSIDGCGPYLKEEAMTLEEALLSFTSMGAYASFEENEKGLIQNGYIADFTILEENPFEIDVNHIYQIGIHSTYLSGKCVFENNENF